MSVLPLKTDSTNLQLVRPMGGRASQRLTRHGVPVQVKIYEDGEGKWILEVVDAQNASHVWDDHFESDQQALAEAIRALEEETVEFMGAPGETG